MAIIRSTKVGSARGAGADKAFDAAANVHYDALSDGKPCEAGCKQTVVKHAAIGDAGEVQLRKATADYGDVYGIVFGKGAQWWSPDVFDDLPAEDCSPGKCVAQDIAKLTVTRADDLVWIVMQIRVKLTHSELHDATRYSYDIVVGCKLGAAPTCARVLGGGKFDAGTAKVKGKSVVVHDSDGTRTVPIAF